MDVIKVAGRGPSGIMGTIGSDFLVFKTTKKLREWHLQ